MGYKEVEDLTAYVALPATTGTLADEGAALLVWTTQPWTLVPNVSVVVGPEIDYVLVEATGEDGRARRLVVARDAVARAVGEDARVLRPVPLEELLGTRYQRAFDLIPVTEEEAARGWTVVADEYVTTGDGSGLVQTSPPTAPRTWPSASATAPRCCTRSARTASSGRRRAGWPLRQGRRRRPGRGPAPAGLLWRAETHTHAYPFCWRCGTR